MGKNCWHGYVALGVFAIISLGYFIAAWCFPVAYIWISYEDLYGEWAQTYLFVIALLFSIRLAMVPGMHRRFFLLLAMTLIYVVMEEISWGQRILGFDTPTFFLRNNLQQEANLHNLFVGPFGTSTKKLIELLLAGGLFGYGVLYPLLLHWRVKLAHALEGFGLLSPPVYLVPFFAMAAVLELGLLQFNEAEIAELLVAYAVAMLGAHYWIVICVDHRFPDKPPYQNSCALRSLLMIGVLFATILLSVVTTESLYADESRRVRIENRILNGYEKFARRYEYYDQWETAVVLYEKVLEETPSRTAILRALANCHRELGDESRFRYYNEQALNLALKRYATDPARVAFNLSLARSYRQRGDDERASLHLSKAKKTAVRDVEREPHSAKAYYWLAETFRELGDTSYAAKAYRRAYELQPESARYRKAYFGMEVEAEEEV